MPTRTRASSKAAANNLPPAHGLLTQSLSIPELPAQGLMVNSIPSSESFEQEPNTSNHTSTAVASTKTEEPAPDAGQKLAAILQTGQSSSINQSKQLSACQPEHTGQQENAADKSTTVVTSHEISLNALPHALNVEAGQASFTTVAEAALVAERFYQSQAVRLAPPTSPSLDVATTPEKNRKSPKLVELDLGRNPFPRTPFPKPDQAHEVAELLYQRHGQIGQPIEIPTPAADAAGCGEVKFVLEALVRTIISQNVEFKLANAVVLKLINYYKRFKDGPTAGCVDWDRVRREGRKPLEKILRAVGCQVQKSKCIIDLLEQVHQIDMNLRVALRTHGEGAFTYETFVATQVDVSLQQVLLDNQKKRGLKNEPKTRKLRHGAPATEVEKPDSATTPFMVSSLGQAMLENAAAVLRSGHRLLTMDYMHAWPTDKVFAYLQTFNGIAVKTSACTTLFCLQRPTIAVDVHVERISKMLEWVPVSASVQQAFFYLNLWIPDKLKYALHQLFIVHGKLCLRCHAKSKPTTPGWKEMDCCLEGLLTRDILLLTKKRKAKAVVDNVAKNTAAGDDAEEHLDDQVVNTARTRLESSKSERGTDDTNAVRQESLASVAEGSAKKRVKKASNEVGEKSKAKQQKQSKITDTMPTAKPSTSVRKEQPLNMPDLEYVFGASAGRAMLAAAEAINGSHQGSSGAQQTYLA